MYEGKKLKYRAYEYFMRIYITGINICARGLGIRRVTARMHVTLFVSFFATLSSFA